MRRLSIITICFAALFGCGGTEKPTSYKDRAEFGYRSAQELLEDGSYIEALNGFNTVKNEFPYSPYAALAALGVGHVYFEEEKYVEAIDVYRLFVRSYPEHPEVATALFKEAKAFFEQRPSDFAIFPPSYERDRGPTSDTINALRRFLARFPKDKRVSDANNMLKVCRGSLADYELYVAKFYLNEDKPWSAQKRLETITKNFSDTPKQWREASVLLISTYLALTETLEEGIEPLSDGRLRARQVAEMLRKAYPQSRESLSKEVRDAL